MQQKQKKPHDPYHLDFSKLRKEYMEETSQKLKFSKPSFLHYCKNPYIYHDLFGGDDTILTMELMQAPTGLKFKDLKDPKEVEKLAKAKKVQDAKDKIKAEQAAKKEIVRRATQLKKEAAQEEKRRIKAAKKALKKMDDDGEDDYDDDDDDDEEEDEVSDDEVSPDEDEIKVSSEEDEEYYHDSYGSEGSITNERDSLDDNSEEEREYDGDMFKNKPLNYALSDRTIRGEFNKKTESTEFSLISVWKIGGEHLRFSRIADVIVPFPPVSSNESKGRFYISHSGDALYYLALKSGKECIVVVYLADFRWRVFDFHGKDIPELADLDDSALICNNHVLVINVPEGIKKKQFGQLSGDYVAYDLFNLEKIWHVTNAERVFFSGYKQLKGIEGDAFDGSQLSHNMENKQILITAADKAKSARQLIASKQINMPEKIIVMTQTVKEITLPHAESKDPKKPAKEKTETRLFFNYYRIKDFNTVDFVKDGEFYWEHSELTEMKPTNAPQTTRAGGMLGKMKNKMLEAVNASEEEDAESILGKHKQDGRPDVLYAHDDKLEDLVMIVMGVKGEQHHVYQFNSHGDKSHEKERHAKKKSQRPGNCKVEMNQNSFIRLVDELFIILIASTGETAAKPLGSSSETHEKLPSVEMFDADGSFALDCWIVIHEHEHEHHYDEYEEHEEKHHKKTGVYQKGVIQTICKSNSDEFLNSSSMNITPILSAHHDVNAVKHLKTIQCKIKNQEIQMQYPVIASNIGTRRINVQSIAQPNIHAQFRIPEADFLSFVDYHSLKHIGFNDKRKKQEQAQVQFNETGEHIAFISRAHEKCEKKDQCETGDILLNILFVDSYSEPMTFKLYTTDYEACMMEGSRDDVIHKAFAFEVKSGRGCDVTYCIQYNDSIILDCITSTKQKPIMFPMTKKQLEKDETYEESKATLDCKIIPVHMFMDEHGSIFLLVTDAAKKVSVYRTNTEKEMGEDSFFQLVFHFQASWVYFFQKVGDKFYMMDDSKRVRILVQDPKNHTLSVVTTLDLLKEDKEKLRQVPFDEFIITPGCVHWDNYAFNLIENKTKDNPTWACVNLDIKGYETVSGPKNATGAGQMFFIQEYTGVGDNDDDDETHQHGPSHGQYCVVMMPKADLSFLSCLPIAHHNHNNFCSFITNDKLMVQYGGRFLVFNTKGGYEGQVKFECAKHINVKRLRLINFCESKQYFVFEGPEMLERERKQGDNLLNPPEKKTEEKKAKWIYYIFKLDLINNTYGEGRLSYYTLTHYHMAIEPIINPEQRFRQNILMGSSGYFSQICITNVQRSLEGIFSKTEVVNYEVELHQAQSYPLVDENLSTNILTGWFTSKIDKNAIAETKFSFKFDVENLNEQIVALGHKIKPLEKEKYNAHKHGKHFAHHDDLARLVKRQHDMHKAWQLGNYIIVKCGSDLQFCNITDKIPHKFNFDLGSHVWLQSIYLTGVEGLLQFYVIDDEERIIYTITWNMELNREHSLFQTTYKQGQFPENLILQSFSTRKGQTNFNFCLEDGCIINLENNLPIQFFDVETEGDLVPHGALKHTVPGQKKVNEDKSKYLDLLVPGRIQHFISYMDLVYWDRFQHDKVHHELSKGKVTSFSPIAKFPKGISIFHYYATNEQVIKTFREAMELALNENRDDKRISLMPLMFLHKHPVPNKAGHRVTPMQVAIEKQSPACFESMLAMLTQCQGVCITGHLLGRLQELIGMGSPAVTELLNDSFRITDQLSGPRPLEWPGDAEELFINVPTAYLTDDTLQKMVFDAMDFTPAPDAPEEEAADPNAGKEQYNDGFLKYSVEAVEAVAQFDDAENNLKQVEAKLLDFDWIFTGNNAATLLNILAETDNDEIFSCAQIRVFIEFMWADYYKAIYSTLFKPFLLYFICFNLYATQFGATDGQKMDLSYVIKWMCLVYWGKTFITFSMLEFIQFRADPVGYFAGFWNMLDFLSLTSCGYYMYCSLAGELDDTTGFFNLNILGSIAVVMLWMKLFYWLRLFKPFSMFIRILSEIVKDIRVFSAMLFLCIAAFANVLMVLQDNRPDGSPIYDDNVGFGPADALIHAYLTGLGDFSKDNYSNGDAVAVWIFFLLATLIVQLIFMNMLIAIMGESFGRITCIANQSVLKELCVMMNDHIWLLKISELFSGSRYILWLTPGANKVPGTVIERQIQQLRNYVEERAEESDSTILRQMAILDEKIEAIAAHLDPEAKEDEDDDENQE